LAPYAEGFRDELARLGYTPLTAATHVRLMAHLSRWLTRQGLSAAELTPARVDVYFAARRETGYVGQVTGRALDPLVTYLRRLEVLPAPEPAVGSEADRLLAEYRDYLRTERGLAEKTVFLNARLLRPFLLDRENTRGGLDLARVTAGEVTAFVTAQSRQRPKSVGRIVTALRSLLGFLHATGAIDQPLAAAVPSPAGWTQTSLPQALDEDQVAALLASCDPHTPTGCRDLAILTLLARLGLRAGEVAALRLEDIDWRRGEFTVRGKGNRHDRLPLPADVGERIVAYLQHGRPKAAQDHTVFLRAQAPYRALGSGAVSTIVATASRRAGLGTLGAHRLRHSAATTMLRSGASLSEVGQTLRHARFLTTAIYAKVDLAALRGLVRPWPGEAA
jgi:site-specific recombinase XerD